MVGAQIDYTYSENKSSIASDSRTIPSKFLDKGVVASLLDDLETESLEASGSLPSWVYSNSNSTLAAVIGDFESTKVGVWRRPELAVILDPSVTV